ncbi:MAG: carbon monoxide dehydrogenase [Geminicoccus sp.]|nr:carbon monoxide dehydrogenase [Geminicoccus sp.]
MEFSGSSRLRADRAAVWEALNDPAVLQACIPGCERFEHTGEGLYAIEVGGRIGPIKALFTGSIRLVELDTARTYRLEGEGSGGVAGMAKGIADVQLDDIASGTELAYAITAVTDGPIARFGAKMMTGTAQRFTERFFDALAEHLGGKLEQASAG